MRYLLLLITLGLLLAARAGEAPTVEAAYLGLSSGPLRQARLVELPAGTVLRAGTVTITEKQVTEYLASVKPIYRAVLGKNRFFILENQATPRLLQLEARAWAATLASAARPPEGALIQAYLRSAIGEITVTAEECRAFFRDNPHLFGNDAYADVAAELQSYLEDTKRAQATEAYVNAFSTRLPVEVDAAWVKTQAATALDTPVDKARRAGKPLFLELSAPRCPVCRQMAPLIAEVRKTAGKQCAFLTINVDTDIVIAARYGAEKIPCYVLFDQDGQERFRHTGYLPKEQLLAQLAKVGKLSEP